MDMNNNIITKNAVLQALGLFFMASLLLTSCLKNQEDYFEDSATVRMSKTINQTKEILLNSEYGWEFEYYPDRTLTYGGLVYTVKFDSLMATVACSLIPDSTVTTYYRLTNDNGPVLTFDTYNTLLHFFATPSASEYQAKDGDFEFVIHSISEDLIVLYGKKTLNTMYLRKLKYSPQEYAAKTIAISENFVQSLSGTMGTDEVTGDVDLNTKSIEFIHGNDTITSHFVFNDQGIRLYAPLRIGGVSAQTFTFDAETNVLKCVDEGSEDISFQGVPHDENYIPFSMYAGNYKLHYFNNQLEANVSLVPSRIDATYHLKGLSSKYELILNYDFNTGELTLSPQMIGVINDRAVYFLTSNISAEGYMDDIWIGEECALKLIWNKNMVYPAFTFEAVAPVKYPCNSGVLMILYYDEDEILRGDEVTDMEWLTNQMYYFPYLNSLTKLSN